MKASACLVTLIASLALVTAPSVAWAGVDPPGIVPEPTALLVWLGLASAGGLFFWRRNRES